MYRYISLRTHKKYVSLSLSMWLPISSVIPNYKVWGNFWNNASVTLVSNDVQKSSLGNLRKKLRAPCTMQTLYKHALAISGSNCTTSKEVTCFLSPYLGPQEWQISTASLHLAREWWSIPPISTFAWCLNIGLWARSHFVRRAFSTFFIKIGASFFYRYIQS